MFCGKCGNSIADGASFCPKCGNSLVSTVCAVENSPNVVHTETDTVKETDLSAPLEELTQPVIPKSSEPKEKKTSAGLIVLFVLLGLVLIAGIVFGVLSMSGFFKEKPAPAPPSQTVSVNPAAALGKWDFNISFTDLPIGKPLDTAFDTQLKDVRYRLVVHLGEDNKAALLLYKPDVDSAATNIFEIFRDYRISELYNAYYNSDGMPPEEVERIFFEEKNISVSEYVTIQMKNAGITKESILEDITKGLSEFDGRTWLLSKCKYRIDGSLIILEDSKGTPLISFVFFGDEKMTVYESHEKYAFLVGAEFLKSKK